MRHVTIIATSLNLDSRSHDLAVRLAAVLTARGVPHTSVDLRELDPPPAGSPGCWDHPDTEKLKTAVAAASHVVFAVPIYCYDANAAAKNVVELVGRTLTEKVVAFMCSAGGEHSYMAVMGLANHLMLDFRSVIVPRFVYASRADWSEDGELDAEVAGRIERLVDDMARISVAAP